MSKSKSACEVTIAVIELEMKKDLPLSTQIYLHERKSINQQIMQDESLLRSPRKTAASESRKRKLENNKQADKQARKTA